MNFSDLLILTLTYLKYPVKPLLTLELQLRKLLTRTRERGKRIQKFLNKVTVL